MGWDQDSLFKSNVNHFIHDTTTALNNISDVLKSLNERMDRLEGKPSAEPIESDSESFVRIKNIDECIENIDWGKIHKVMTFLDWQWIGQTEDGKSGVPTIEALINHVRSDLNRCYELMDKYNDDNPDDETDDYFIESGGFRVRTFIDNGCEVMFILSDASTRY